MIERTLLVLTSLPLGACLGSYTATAAIRHTRQEQSISGRSRCDGCAAQLSFVQTLPVIAFARQGGRCQSCDGRIDRAHLIGEVGGGLILSSAFAFAPLAQALPLAVLGLALLASSVIDAKTQRLPDVLTLIIALLGAALAAQRSWNTLIVGAVAAVLAFALLDALRRGFLLVRRRPGLGFGDVKLIAALALWLGLATPWAICLAAILGLAVVTLRRSAEGRLAFGPYIAAGAWLVGLGMEAGRWPLPA